MRRLAFFFILIFLLVVGWWAATGGFHDPANSVADAGSGRAKTVTTSNTDTNTENIIPLNGANTDIQWTGSNSIGQQPTGFFYELTGTVAIDPDTNQLKRLELDIDMNGVKAIANSLTKKLKHSGFFEVDQFPRSTFISTDIQTVKNAEQGLDGDCIVEGNFQLRDVTRSIRLPMKFSWDDQTVRLESQFRINRSDYGVKYSDPLGDKLIRDAVVIDLSIAAEKEDLSPSKTLAPSEDRPALAKLENFTETIPATLVEFEMVLVPGDQQNGIEPFWIGKTEVTWEEFDYWALCKGLPKKEAIDQISRELRPSSPHDIEKVYRGWGRENQPVVGVSRLAADLYCKWLSQQTGRKYHLPTSAQWQRAYQLGGGDTAQTPPEAKLEKIAWFANNALGADEEGFDFERAMPVASLAANDLGIHDMLGNAAEWVTDEDGKAFVLGGHFKLSAQGLNSFREFEDQAIWNKDYPQLPKSIWWYVNADYVGFRIVCEP